MPKIERARHVWQFYELSILYSLVFLAERFAPAIVPAARLQTFASGLPAFLQSFWAFLVLYLLALVAAFVVAGCCIYLLGFLMLSVFPEETLELAEALREPRVRWFDGALTLAVAMGGYWSQTGLKPLVVTGFVLYLFSMFVQFALVFWRVLKAAPHPAAA